MLATGLAKRLRIGLERLDPHVERTLRVDDVIADLLEAVVEDLAVAVVGFDVDWRVDAFGDGELEEHRVADVAERTAGTAHGLVDMVEVGHRVGDEQVADALARQRERLGPRVADEGRVVEARDPRRLETVVDELAVGLVADEVDRVAVFGGLGTQQVGERLEILVIVDRAHGVVGRVDDDRGRLGSDGGGDGIDVEHEVACACGHLDGHRAGIARPGLVLGEVRRDGDELLAGEHDGLDGDADGSRGASREIEVAGRVMRVVAAVEVLGDGLARLDEAGRHRIHVHGAFALVDQASDGLVDDGGGGDARVADGEVEDLVVADLRLALEAVGEYLANLVGCGAQCVHVLVDHECSLVADSVMAPSVAHSRSRWVQFGGKVDGCWSGPNASASFRDYCLVPHVSFRGLRRPWRPCSSWYRCDRGGYRP